MATVTRKYGGDAKAKVWFVRNEQGVRFGPVDFETLKAWACDGRVGPANEISADGTEWLPATEQRGLAMDWVAEVSPGRFYGPIHKDAMRDLLKEGAIAGQAELFRRQALDADADEEARALRDGCERLRAELEQTRGRVSELEGESLRARQQAVAREGELRVVRDKLEAQAAQAEDALRREQAKSGELERRLVQTGLEREAAARRLAELDAECQAQAAAWAEQRRALACEEMALKEEVARALAETASRTERIAQLEAAAAAALAEAARQREALEGKVCALQAESASAQAELAAQRQAVRQAQARCEAQAETLDADRRAREGALLQVAEMNKELAESRREAERLRDALNRQAERPGDARAAAAVEVLEAEPLDSEPRPKARPKQRPEPAVAEVLPPERPGSAPRTPPHAGPAGRAAPGISMADLEQQARRELERLGAHGQSFFTRKK